VRSNIDLQGDPELPKIIYALCILRGEFCPRERRKKQAGQNRYDGNHHQKLNERESFFGSPMVHKLNYTQN
jgi:hypothetical protein